MDGSHGWLRGGGPAVLACLAAWSLHWGCSQSLRDGADLGRRVEEVGLWIRGEDPYADPDATYPPSALPVFAAVLGPLPETATAPVWLGLNLAALAAFGAGCLAIWGRGWTRSGALAFLLWLAACRPVRAGLALGQFHLIPAALLVWTVPALRSGRPAWTGVLLGLALVKPTMALPVALVWMVVGRWKALGVAASVQAGLWLLASVWLSVSPLRLGVEWLANARSQVSAGALDVPSLVARLAPGGGVSAPWVSLLVLLGGGLVLWRLRSAGESTLLALAMGLAAVFTYHRHYDLVLLVPLILALGSRAGRLDLTLAMAMAGLLVVATNPAWMRPLERPVEVAFAAAMYAGLARLAARAGHPLARAPRPHVSITSTYSNRTIAEGR
jgi:hypothetical protein